jgi:hypothetical protein
MLMSLLPGLRELRAPLASGYLWLVSAWLFLGRMDWLPTHRPTDNGEVARLWELGDALGTTAVFAAVTFIAYLIGSFLEMDPDGRMARILTPVILADRRPWYLVPDLYPSDTVTHAEMSIRHTQDASFEPEIASTVARSISREARRDLLDVIRQRKMLPEKVHSYRLPRPASITGVPREEEDEWVWERLPPDVEDVHYLSLRNEMAADIVMFRIVEEMQQLASRLLVKNKDLYGKYDRQMAEASLRMNVSIPLTVLLVLVIWLSGLPIWLRLALTVPTLAFGFMLLRQGFLRAVSARDAIVQALTIGEVQSRYIPEEESTESSAEEPAERKESVESSE